MFHNSYSLGCTKDIIIGRGLNFITWLRSNEYLIACFIETVHLYVFIFRYLPIFLSLYSMNSLYIFYLINSTFEYLYFTQNISTLMLPCIVAKYLWLRTMSTLRPSRECYYWLHIIVGARFLFSVNLEDFYVFQNLIKIKDINNIKYIRFIQKLMHKWFLERRIKPFVIE